MTLELGPGCWAGLARIEDGRFRLGALPNARRAVGALRRHGLGWPPGNKDPSVEHPDRRKRFTLPRREILAHLHDLQKRILIF